MFIVEYRKIGECTRSVEFETENDMHAFLNGETVMDANEYWMELSGAEVINVRTEE